MSKTNQSNLISISHKIELKPNNKAITHFKKAFGCSRLAYNWGLAKWQEYYKQGVKKSYLDLKKEFNAIKKEQFPFVYDVSKYATQQPFLNLNLAFNKFFRDLKQGKLSYPKFKKKKENFGSYYIGGDQIIIKNEKYLKIPNFGLVKIREKLRFNGKINSVTISQKANKFYASFSMQISHDEYNKTHKIKNLNNQSIGIDLGIKEFVCLSNGLMIKAPKPLNKLTRLLVKRQRRLSKKQHAKTKQEAINGVKKSNNYLKESKKLAKLHSKIANIRSDFLHKLSSIIIKNFDYIGLESLNVKGMIKNHKLAKSLVDVSFYEFNRQLEYKANYMQKEIHRVDKFYPSSKTCCVCGNIKQDLTLKDRIYKCKSCGNIIDRDLNASINLHKFVNETVGIVNSEFTPMDLTALLDDLAINQIVTSKVEVGIQQKFY
ncbi:RNA-guided endonuclease InsQ/TnpB family protein [Campylobacter fetus]|uniref:RNA-guided endonuclease InsQ/TnpB family protein n=1 Tax=Campylobacter fetus TaxID=196 RepID=UPI0003D8C6BB|nr:RNA-guided endonuclease TnpB family protein [Campylobacter fetus]AHE95193.1 transposase, IS605 family OrfB [Campylobacter fetus subsp. venerealis cfvi03/293]AIR79816.1 IS605/IS607 family transposase [Campylobacter fetus subsp. venerealis 97/608]AIR80137.1 IS605/IS607 family transposase [Campylobacter fetus subsp. venerealis 97/608]AIR80269.1 IS605/IS607 family transposase [Campylobacter fetus subsp. venerealis 97/608]AIR80462.1 IS605/IS607 family transposase [Campylobacter fetus subsp. vene